MRLPPRVKRVLRPLVYRARFHGHRVARLLHPPVPWDGRHHPALLRFTPWKGEADGRFVYDFLGIRTDPRFQPHTRADPAGPLETTYPPPLPNYFELAFVLDSLASAAADRCTVAELGAGYGRWLVTAHRARRLTSDGPIRLVGVELVRRHYEWMQLHLRNNGIDPTEHVLIHAAISDVDGEATYQPEEDPALTYGQSLELRRPSSERIAVLTEPGEHPEREQAPRPPGPVDVPAIGLARLLRELGRVDLMHVDIQGEERRALPAALPELNGRVRYLLVATHSNRIHRQLRGLLAAAGWRSVFDFRCGKRERTPFGDVHFVDGLLAVVNSSLVPGRDPRVE